MRVVVLVSRQSEPLQPAARHRLGLLRRCIEDLEAEQHVCQRRPLRHQPVALKHDANLAAKELEIAERIMARHDDLA
jgi:hypothetical protein